MSISVDLMPIILISIQAPTIPPPRFGICPPKPEGNRLLPHLGGHASWDSRGRADDVHSAARRVGMFRGPVVGPMVGPMAGEA
eukprot:39547-Pyramimonas_sp.AAC.1